MTTSIKILGIPETRIFLKNKGKNVKGSITRAMNLVGIHTQGEVKTSIAGQRAEPKSVDTGRFMNSVDFTADKEKTIVFSKIPYAGKLEYGTNFKNSPRKHFRNTLAREKQKNRDIIQKEINKI